jgi:hypothetical protein
MAQSGTYGPLLKEDLPGNNPTYYIRFLYDTGYINNEATALGLQLNQYGMVKDDAGNGIAPLNTWWMLPYNVMDNTILANDPNQDRDGGIILGILWLVFVTLPWLPYVNKIPDKLRLYRLFWKVKTKK